jgi:adenosylcobinamide-GDP ribazoletransferase
VLASEEDTPQGQEASSVDSAGAKAPDLRPYPPEGKDPWGAVLLGAIAFYTRIPIPNSWPMSFQGIALWAPVIGLLLGSILSGLDGLLGLFNESELLRSLILVLALLGLTGGLHFDGAMDTADGLSVGEPHRRLDVMADSRTGAFGVMTAIALLAIKTLALAEITHDRGWVMTLGLAWGRWGHLWAVAQYPYLRLQGKGALHKQAVKSRRATLPSLCLLLLLSCLYMGLCGQGQLWVFSAGAVALWLADYFYRRLGGHTGDTYGAIVEWTEALFWMIMGLWA